MKKRTLNSLVLNKKTISALEAVSSIGGDCTSTWDVCERQCIYTICPIEGATCATC
ncbi:hypothetical protein U8527_08530 [Kordia algicida OT-1]|nr:hypothetical protein [Kordia algicida]